MTTFSNSIIKIHLNLFVKLHVIASYVGTERWLAPLDHLINKKYTGPPVGTAKGILHQIAKAVDYLSSKDLINRNINPDTILITDSVDKNPPKVKLVDFSVSRRLHPGQNKIEYSGNLSKNLWTAPEFLQNETYTPAVDVFSAGCVFAYFLFGGKHPFGPFHVRLRNIKGEKIDWPQNFSDETAKDLITGMVRADPHKRITIKKVLAHPFFWDEDKHLKFADAIVRLGDSQIEGPIGQSLESAKVEIFPGCWTDHLTEFVRRNLFDCKCPMKDTEQAKSSLFHLLKAFCNKVSLNRAKVPSVIQFCSSGNILQMSVRKLSKSTESHFKSTTRTGTPASLDC